LTSSTAAAFVAAGFQFAVRYLSRGAESSGDLTSSEVNSILGAGLALSAVQHVSSDGWCPSQQLGQEYGAEAAQNAGSVGLPQGMNIWLDLEGVNASASAADVSAYCNAWFGEVSAAKYVPGLYVGAQSILDADELDALNVAYFWKSASSVPYPSNGYCMVQSISSSYVIDGVAYDRDVIQQDNLGKTPLLAVSAKSAGISVSAGSFFKWAGALLAGLLLYGAGVYTAPWVRPAAPPSPQSAPAEKPTPPETTQSVSPQAQTPAPTPSAQTGSKSSLPTAGILLQVGSFAQEDNAQHIAGNLRQAGYRNPVVTQATVGGKLLYVVHLGPYSDRADAEKIAGQIKAAYGLTATIQQ